MELTIRMDIARAMLPGIPERGPKIPETVSGPDRSWSKGAMPLGPSRNCGRERATEALKAAKKDSKAATDEVLAQNLKHRWSRYRRSRPGLVFQEEKSVWAGNTTKRKYFYRMPGWAVSRGNLTSVPVR